MKIVSLAAAALLLRASAASAQVATPNLSLPPCNGANCLHRARGATTVHPAASSAVKQACPAGTVFDTYKGVCHVTRATR